jgi:hypothetical protein
MNGFVTTVALGKASPFCYHAGMQRRALLQVLCAAPFAVAYNLTASGQGQSMGNSTTVHELRVYHVEPGKLPDLLKRFRDDTIRIFAKHQMKLVAFWTPVDEPENNNTLVYILQHPSRAAAPANWKSFQDDPEWKTVKAKSEANGKLVTKIDSTFLTLTDFSPRLE